MLSGRVKAEALVGGAPAHRVGRRPADAGGADRAQAGQRRQPRLHRRGGDHRGSARASSTPSPGRCSSRGSTSTARRSPARPTAPSTSSTCATRRPRRRSPTPARMGRLRKTLLAWPGAPERALRPMSRTTLLVSFLLRSPTAPAAPRPSLEKGERCFARATWRGPSPPSTRPPRPDRKDARAPLPEGRGAGEERRRGRARQRPTGRRSPARRTSRRPHNNLGALLIAGGSRPRPPSNWRRRCGASRPTRRRNTTSAWRATPSGKAGGGRRLSGGGAPQTGRRWLPDESGRGAAAGRGHRRGGGGAAGSDPTGPGRCHGLGRPGHGALRQEELRRGGGRAGEGDQAEARLRAGLELPGAGGAEAGAGAGGGGGFRKRHASWIPRTERLRRISAAPCSSRRRRRERSTECRAAVELDPKNPLAHYELTKALVAKGDCGGAKAALAQFEALPGVKPEAKKQAEAIAASCRS